MTNTVLASLGLLLLAHATCSQADNTNGKNIFVQRCAMCHNAQLQQKNVALHTPELVKQHAQGVYQQVAVLKLMPLNNATQITDAERALIKRWFEAGAPTN